MTTASQRGDIGNLALADAALGALLIDIAILATTAAYPDPPNSIDQGMTTRRAALEVQRYVETDPDLFPDDFPSWLPHVLEATDLRNRILHAVAVNTCGQCGAATLFRHPRTGCEVNRTDEAVQAVTARTEELHRLGVKHAGAIAHRVNDRIERTARRAAESTNEIQNPPQVGTHRPEYLCRECDPTGRGQITLRPAAGLAVWPREKLQELREELARPHTERV